MAFIHTIRPRYAEVDMQGVVFNAHWLTFFDDAYTRFIESLGYVPSNPDGADMMLVKATLEWKGSAGFDEPIEIEVRPERLGNSSLDMRYLARVDGKQAVDCLITYVVIEPGTRRSIPIPDKLRATLEQAMEA